MQFFKDPNQQYPNLHQHGINATVTLELNETEKDIGINLSVYEKEFQRYSDKKPIKYDNIVYSAKKTRLQESALKHFIIKRREIEAYDCKLEGLYQVYHVLVDWILRCDYTSGDDIRLMRRKIVCLEIQDIINRVNERLEFLNDQKGGNNE